jgi:hypothetical protein
MPYIFFKSHFLHVGFSSQDWLNTFICLLLASEVENCPACSIAVYALLGKQQQGNYLVCDCKLSVVFGFSFEIRLLTA